MDTRASLLNLDIYVTFRDLDTDLYYFDIESGLTHDTAPTPALVAWLADIELSC